MPPDRVGRPPLPDPGPGRPLLAPRQGDHRLRPPPPPAGPGLPLADRPAAEPLLLLKLAYLQYHYNLADRKVLEQAQVNIAFRFFLDLGLVAQPREPLLEAAQSFLPEWAAEHRGVAQAIRTTTADLGDDERLLQRVGHLRQIVARLDLLLADEGPATAGAAPARTQLGEAVALAHVSSPDGVFQQSHKAAGVRELPALEQ